MQIVTVIEVGGRRACCVKESGQQGWRKKFHD
jgi:hypothetical protein